MAQARCAYCEEWDARSWLAREFELPCKLQLGDAKKFWAHLEKEGRLIEALETYDKCASALAEWRKTKRETKREFWERVEREGRKAKAERLRKKLLQSGLSKREVQEKLVKKLQPQDGSETRWWNTPNPWENGRLFRRKADQQELLEIAVDEDRGDEFDEARERVFWAKLRRDERQALKEARRRAVAAGTAQDWTEV